MRLASNHARASTLARRRSLRRGVSLLEAVAALAIVGATSAGVLAAVGAGTRTAARARHAHEAESLALELHASLAVQSEATLRALPDSLAAGRFRAPFDGYTWRARVRPDATAPGLYEVRVDIDWPSGSQSLSTAFYRRATAIAAEAP
ncbi:type II secretion system protein [Gemmatimonas sp.]